MDLLIANNWPEYELVDSGGGMRLERFGEYLISRPDPQCIWSKKQTDNVWKKVDAYFVRDGNKDKGEWHFNTKMPNQWEVSYNDLKFWAKLTPFKHTGIFPEQSIQWDFIQDQIKKADRKISTLNLFAYTGGATLAAAAVGASITHVDGSKPALSWARSNQELSGFDDKPIRWILDDVVKFVAREARRGKKYDAIIMDPPVYGHGPDGEIWDFSKDFPRLLNICGQLLSDQPLFVIVNAYAISSSPLMLKNVFEDVLSKKGKISVGELALEEKLSKRLLSTGLYARWVRA